jgi:Sec7-like guanine-nucleotide exchange factor
LQAFELSVMHAWMDGERYAGLTIDAALRRLLAQFRIPGEAQKIDRIMEKVPQAPSGSSTYGHG